MNCVKSSTKDFCSQYRACRAERQLVASRPSSWFLGAVFWSLQPWLASDFCLSVAKRDSCMWLGVYWWFHLKHKCFHVKCAVPLISFKALVCPSPSCSWVGFAPVGVWFVLRPATQGGRFVECYRGHLESENCCQTGPITAIILQSYLHQPLSSFWSGQNTENSESSWPRWVIISIITSMCKDGAWWSLALKSIMGLCKMKKKSFNCFTLTDILEPLWYYHCLHLRTLCWLNKTCYWKPRCVSKFITAQRAEKVTLGGIWTCRHASPANHQGPSLVAPTVQNVVPLLTKLNLAFY